MFEDYLQQCDKRYSQQHQLLASTIPTGSYQCALRAGSEVHPTLNSLCYAITLLRAGGDDRVRRATDIIAKVLSLQDTDATSRTFGIWPVYIEEPLAVTEVPDFNWADFMGSQLVYIRRNHTNYLTAELLAKVDEALLSAALAIFRRNVGSGYTNIAFAGAAVTAAIGELLGRPEFVRYARQRFHNIIQHTDYHGGFTEYNSPTYAFISLQYCEWTHQMVEDDYVLQAAEKLRRTVWEYYAGHFHPGTSQLAGPHARAYSNWLQPDQVWQLSVRTGANLASRLGKLPEGPDPTGVLSYVEPMPCPSDIAQRFERLLDAPVERHHCYIRLEDQSASIRGTTWLTHNACLGSVNHDNLWVQRHPLIGYWRTDVDPAVCFRLRFLHDGQDFASAYIRTCQRRCRVLSTLSLLTNKGDWHPHLDRPEIDGLFEAEDFRLRCELTGCKVSGQQLDERRYELSAGDHKVVIHTAPGQFGPYDITWELGQSRQGDDQQVFVDAICYQGARREFQFQDLGNVVLVVAAEILGISEEASDAAVELDHIADDTLRASWAAGEGLSVTGPLQSHRHPVTIEDTIQVWWRHRFFL